MLAVLAEKELKAVVRSPKFAATFAVCSLLILLSVYVGVREYEQSVRQYEAVSRLNAQRLAEQSSWMSVSSRVHRRPDPMQVFVSGVNYDVGRLSGVNAFQPVKLTNSIYSDDPIFAVFRFIDFVFIVQVVLSLFAILFSYDAINGERESGTLRLVFANPVPRARFMLGKLGGIWLALVVPLLVPLLLGLLIVLLRGVPFERDHWLALGVLLAISLVYFSLFLVLGLAASALTRRSRVSFLVALVAWVVMVLVIPRVGVMLAGQILPAPSAAVVDGQIEGFSKQRWTRHMEEMQEIWRKRSVAMEGMTEEEREAYRDEHTWDWIEEDDAARKSIQTDIDAFTAKLTEDLRNRKAAQERLALGLSRVSPASAYRLAAMNTAGTDSHLKSRYEDAMRSYRQTFLAYVEKKREEQGEEHGGIQINWSTDSGFKINTGRRAGTLDLSDMPRFEPPLRPLDEVVAGSLVDLGLLGFFVLAGFAVGFVAFLRYDVR